MRLVPGADCLVVSQHEKHRAQKDLERTTQRMEEEEAKRKATAQLREAKERDHNRKMKYKGMVALPAAQTSEWSH